MKSPLIDGQDSDQNSVTRNFLNLLTETPLTFSAAAKQMEVHPSTIHRWAMRGRSGSKLEAIRVGSNYRTSVEALRRFLIARNSK